MKCFVGFVFASLLICTAFAEICSSRNCVLQKGCVCSSKLSPLKNRTQTPQLVLLTFDDSITADVTDNIFLPLLEGRSNPDGSQASATFFVPHEYTDYSKVNEIYNKGHEIGCHSISKSPSDYWRLESEEVLISEFKGQREIISSNANIPIEQIKGCRVPYLQNAGDRLISAYVKSGISYDSSWIAMSNNKYFPYTLDYKSMQFCVVGECPTRSFPGFWISPVVNIQGKVGDCNSLLGCQVTGSATNISNWLISQFNKTYNSERAPLKLLVSAGWIRAIENSGEALEMFLDYLSTKKDVFLVSEWQALQWRSDPVPFDKYHPQNTNAEVECEKVVCQLSKGEEFRYMTTCDECPDVYPWLDNPSGLV